MTSILTSLEVWQREMCILKQWSGYRTSGRTISQLCGRRDLGWDRYVSYSIVDALLTRSA